VTKMSAMQRPPLTWPLMLTMAVCALVFVGVTLQVYASAGIIVLFSLASHPLGWLALAALALALLLSSFTFVRILRRRSTAAARLYLMVVFALSSAATVFDWHRSEAVDARAALWLAFIAGLFFLIKPVTLNEEMGEAK
jgi:hypothetical protein